MITASRIRRRAAAAVAALLAAVAACSVTPGATPGPEATTAPRAAPWPQRPVVELSFDMAPDLHAATGIESVLFTPDQRVCELVFRAWPNKPTAARDGTSLVVTDAGVDGTAVTPRVQAAGAPDGAPGTLVELPLPSCVPADTTIRARMGFRLTLGANSGERFGYSPSDGTAWFGAGFPLLAWVRGQDWARDPAVDMYGETATSEEFRLASLSVTADTDQVVTGTGTAAGTSTPTAGRTTHRFIAESVRDVAVSVGSYAVTEQQFGDVRVHVATPTSGTRVSGSEWASEIGRQLAALQKLLGPYPYSNFWVTIVPAQSDGVEFPTAVQLGDKRHRGIPSLVAHELAHQWLYSLVGNNQARNPWLDESFATFAQAVAANQQDQYQLSDVPDRYVGDLGQPMQFWAREGTFDQYVQGVYNQGAAVLLAGRDQVGADRFDRALRAYIDINAHRVATPADVTAAFQDLPQVTDLLHRHGVLS